MDLRRGSPFDRFMRSLHRRFVLVRGAERIGVGVLIASGGAAGLLPLAWRGVASLPIVLFVLGAGAAVGLIAGIVRRPTRMEAAAEADRQLRLADLLGTAVMIRRRRWLPQPWDEAVMVCADERCRGLSVSSVLLQRWGARAWGGVALSTCMVVVLSLILTQSAPSQAGTSIVADPFAMAEREASGTVAPRPAGRTVGFDAAGRPASPRGQQPEDDRGEGSSEQNVASKSQVAGGTGGTPGGANADPAGGGGSKSAAGAGARSSLPQGPDAAAAKSAGSQDHGRSAAAGGAADPGAGQSGVAAGQTAAAGVSGRVAAVPPWRSDGWPRDQQERLDQQLRTRPEYDAYRDLIRAYFQRE